MGLLKLHPWLIGYFLDVLWNQILVLLPCFYRGIREVRKVGINSLDYHYPVLYDTFARVSDERKMTKILLIEEKNVANNRLLATFFNEKQ